MQQFLDKAIELGTNAGGKLILALIVFIIGRIIINKLTNLLKKGRMMASFDPTAATFFMNAVRIALYVLLVVSIIGILGVPMASIVAVIASCGVAVGLALQGALGNLAGGIMLLVFRPCGVGDYISASGVEGVVREINLFYTVIITTDNRKITVPNSALTGANVVNFSSEPTRRVDLSFNISGAYDIEKVREVILSVLEKNEKVLKDPAPFAAPLEGIPGGLTYTVRAWTASADYWNCYFSLMQEIPSALGSAGIGGPSSPISLVK